MTAKRVGGHALVVLGVVTCAGALAFLLTQGVAHGTDETWGGGTDAAIMHPSESWVDHLPGIPTPHGPPSDEVGSHTIATPYRLKCGRVYDADFPWVSIVVAGATYAEVLSDGERVAFADAWYDTPGNECGYGHNVGGTWFDDLEVRLVPGWHVSRGNYATRAKFQLSVHEYTSTNCTTGYVRSFHDTRGYCLSSGGLGRVTTEDPYYYCHTPHVLVTDRSAGTTFSYKTEISTRICDYNGSNCDTVYSDTGCFRMDYCKTCP